MLLHHPSFSSDLVRSHLAALSQNIGAEGRGEGPFLNAAIFESPLLRPTGQRLPKRKRDSVSLEKSSTVIPRRALKDHSLTRCRQMLRFVMPTSVGNASAPLPGLTADRQLAIRPSTMDHSICSGCHQPFHRYLFLPSADCQNNGISRS